MAALAPSLSSLHPSKPLLKPWRQGSLHFSAPLLFKDPNKQNSKLSYPRRLRVMAATEGSAKNPSKSKEEGDNGEDPSVPSWAKPGSDELPPWARQEAQKESSSFEVPFYVYLLASAITAIAAIGSIFEYVNQRPVFGVLNSDSVFYAPLLGFFAFTGIPSSMIIAIGVSISILVRFYGWDPLFQKAFLWFKSVQAANKEAEEQDRRDGYF